ncbi:HAD-IA family hydrolase [Bacillus hwajinpoensis]|uniref:HAD-IA family hydrolase n=1 Tax=Guptibacillus hwajinpoensis TaxID=208199 RepID=A0A845F2C9_9BACL|nr:HAD-IA family hydrolase [Pseudalkalibacillus hwajinpoensis]
MIKGILFDLDETLLNRKKSVESFICDQYNRYEPYLEGVEGDTYCSRFIELDNNGYTWKDRVYERLVEEYQLPLSSVELLDDYLLYFKQHCHPFPGMLEMLEALKKRNYKLGIITNGRTSFQLSNIRALGIEAYFDTIVISEKEGVKKPEKTIFRRALKRIGLEAHEAVFVGDHLINDIKGAKDVGMKAIWKKRDKETVETGVDYIYSLIDLLSIVEEWNANRNNTNQH